MIWIDFVLLAPLLYGAYKGFASGLIIEVATLAALVLGVLLSLRYAGNVDHFLTAFISIPESYSYYVAFALIFLIVVLAIYLLGRILTKLVNIISLGLFNKLFGLVLGAVKAAVVICAILFFVDALDRRYEMISSETKQGSLCYYPFVNFANGVYAIIVK